MANKIKRFVTLAPINGRKSFGGKATAIEFEDGTIECKSYDTIVARIEKGVCSLTCGKDEHTKNPTNSAHFWPDPKVYSLTTKTHIRAFCDFYNVAVPSFK